MNMYLTIVITILTITQLIRVIQGAIYLYRGNRKRYYRKRYPYKGDAKRRKSAPYKGDDSTAPY